jgi:hypothetical protein
MKRFVRRETANEKQKESYSKDTEAKGKSAGRAAPTAARNYFRH